MVKARPSSSAISISPPGTRSRRHNETGKNQAAKERLTNGHTPSTTRLSSPTPTGKFPFDKITTRSRAANDSSSTSTRKRRELQLHNNSIIINNNCANSTNSPAIDAELKRLHISMKLSNDKTTNHSSSVTPTSPTKSNSNSISNNNNNHNQNNRIRNISSSTKNSVASANSISSSNGFRRSNKNNIQSPPKNENKLNYRQQVLNRYNRKRKVVSPTGEQLQQRSRRNRQRIKNEEENEHEENDDTTDSESRKNRRSALWVLNCEAEEFLFGETAAEKHEVVLPPKPLQPPAKKRRMRATELGDLLKETPLLPSKLRKQSSGSDTSPSSLLSPPIKGDKKINNFKRRLQNYDSSDYIPDSEDDANSELIISTTTPSFTSGSSCIGSPPSHDYFTPSVRLQEILENLELKFSFEDVPSNEVWYKTFSRQDSPDKSFHFQTAESPVILPYERSSLTARALGRFSRLPRKSPRCHASTLAILSSLKPRGRLASGISVNTAGCSTSGPSSPISPCDSSYQTPVTTRQLHHKKSSFSPLKLCSPTSSELHSPNSPSTRRRRNRLSSPPAMIRPLPSMETNMNKCVLKGTEFMWDTLCFIEDPYVLQVLTEMKNPHPVTSLTKAREAKLCSPTTRSSNREKSSSNKQPPSSSKSSAASPTISPKLLSQNRLQHLEKDMLLMKRSPPPMSPRMSSSRSSSRPSSPLSPPSSPSGTRKSKRKSPIVLVSDVMRNTLKSMSLTNGAINGYEDDVLFLSGEVLPPLPSL